MNLLLENLGKMRKGWDNMGNPQKVFDWNKAAQAGMKAANLKYSGEYGFVETEMYWGLDHMVSPAEDALKCRACHRDQENRIDWEALGYPGDQIIKKYRK